ncbi:hypothetical protein Bca4012_000894 [Brassica carinata]|uniref:(rape) hypothetical protein n=1 Tax=Brassica napus TaxID=3708 RepID=A0A816I0G4_BRANA|nr:unnamed protein product [Brassica napus]
MVQLANAKEAERLVLQMLLAFSQAVTAPLYTVNAIALEAYKKYLLVTLIHSGQFSFSLPKCASTAAKSNFKTFIARDVRGVSSNPALIFSIARSEAVIDAYLDGLEASGLDDFSRVTSVASFFVSRVDTLMDKMLENIGTPEALDLRGKAAVAQAALAYQLYQKKFSGPRWEALVKKGAKKQRLLWASTSVKNPAYSDTIYVAPLIGPHTVSTMPDQSRGNIHRPWNGEEDDRCECVRCRLQGTREAGNRLERGGRPCCFSDRSF